MEDQEFNKIRAEIRNLLTPMLTLSTIVLEDPTYEKLPDCARQVEKSVERILKVLER